MSILPPYTISTFEFTPPPQTLAAESIEADNGSVYKKRCFSKFCKIHRKISVLESLFLIKSQVSACNFIKKGTLTKVFSCEFCGIFKIILFTEQLRTTAFESSLIMIDR